MSKLILGITGEIGSGKGVIAKHVVDNYKADAHKFSQVLREVLNRLHLEENRENLAKLSLILRKNFGEDVLAKSMYHDAYEDEFDVVVIDGIRRLEDIRYLRELDHFKLIYIEADMETRYERIKKRVENVGEAEKTFEQFKQEHELETELQIHDLKNYAQYVVENSGTFNDLHKQIDEIIKQNLG